VLGGDAPELGSFYASVAGAAVRDADGVEPVFQAFCAEQRDALVGLVTTRLVQTNVVKRAAALRLGLALVAEAYDGPVTLLEVGCSAGLLLAFDRYRYAAASRT